MYSDDGAVQTHSSDPAENTCLRRQAGLHDDMYQAADFKKALPKQHLEKGYSAVTLALSSNT